jgi:tetratricopeptide (TPR) repeat protein
MTDERRPLAEHLRPALDEARIERQWSAIEAAGLPSAAPARSWRAWTVALSLAVAAGAAAGVLLYPRTAPELTEGAWLHSADQPVSVRLEDGSRVELSPASQLKLVENRPARVTLELRSGEAHFEVKHDRARPFAIAAGPAEVRVIGTRFELSRTTHAGGEALRVQVREGVVEVRRRDRPGEPPQRIHGGESWSAELSEATKTPAPRADAPIDEPDVLPEEADEAAEPEAESGAEPPSAEPSRRPQAHPKSSARTEEPVDDAGALFSRASLARRAGRMRDAADGYAELLARFPADARAGLSAFELGRIRMDALGDPDGAIRALEEALRSAGTASFHEDALARIVIASDALGRRQACRDARARYLARHPNGVHAQVLSARCP